MIYLLLAAAVWFVVLPVAGAAWLIRQASKQQPSHFDIWESEMAQ